MKTTLPLAFALSISSLAAQDLLAVTWSGSTYLVDSHTGASTFLGTGLPGQNGMAKDQSGAFWSTQRLGTTTYTYFLTTIDPTTGAATAVHPSIDLRGMAEGPAGTLYGIANASPDALVSIDLATGTTTTIGGTGFAGIQGLTQHQGVLYAWDINFGLLIVDPNTGVATDPFPGVGGPTGLQGLCSHPDGRLIAGGGSSTNSLYVVDPTTGGSTLIGVMTAPDVRGFEPLGGGSVTAFGQGCNGVAGPVVLTSTGAPQPGNALQFTSGNHEANALGVLTFGLSTTTYQGLQLPLLLDPMFGTSGCRLYASIDASVILVTGPAAPAQLSFAMPLTAGAAGAVFHVQHACLEAVPGGMSWSNALTVRVQ